MENKVTFGSLPVSRPLGAINVPVQAPVAQQAVQEGPTQEQIARWKNPAEIIPHAFKVATKVRAMGSEIKNTIVERDDLIDACMVALVTGNHIVMLGDPGIAKSMLAREICKRILDGRYFEWLLNKTSDPSEILGPFSIKKLEQDRFVRKTTGKIPESEIVFLDEIFKCNEPTLNALLAITNERIFHNDGVAKKIPLISLIGASNEEPDETSLAALYDRLLFRFMVQPVGESINRLKMYDGFLSRRNPANASTANATVTISELVDIRMAARHVVIPKDVINQYDSLLSDLKTKNQIVVTDRRKNEGLGVLQGAAILAGRDIVSVDDFVNLIPVWWQGPEDIKVIRDKILKVANPFECKLAEHKESIAAILKRVEDAPEGTRPQVVVEAKSLLNTIHTDVNKMIQDARKQGKDTAKLEDMKQHVYLQQRAILNKFLGVDDSVLGSSGLGDDFNLDF